MLNRRLLRVKVMQALYAFFQGKGDEDIVKAEKELFLSVQRVYELYLYYLILPIELAQIAEVQMEEARNKILPTSEEKNPNRKFVDSFMIKALKENPFLQRKVEDLNISWDSEQEDVKRLWKQIKGSELYQNFLEEEDTPHSHRKFVEKIYTKFLSETEYFYASFQEKSIYWDFEDSDFALHMAIRYFGKIKSEEKYKVLPEMYKDKDEDKHFVKQLFRKAITEDKLNVERIEGKTKNWEMERIATLDVLLMKMAMIEFLHFSSVPVKVTLNEYIELAKQFSSPKSKVFINGVLDKLLAEFKRDGILKKTGRGLLNT